MNKPESRQIDEPEHELRFKDEGQKPPFVQLSVLIVAGKSFRTLYRICESPYT